MKLVNWLVKILGGFLTSYGVLMTRQTPIEPVWIIVLLTVGLALLFGPEVK